jgi:hypothetical protein
MITGRYAPMFVQALRNSRRVKEATIPVERIQGPILLASFTRDEVWPSTLMSERIMQRLRDSGFRFHFEHAAYDAAHCNWSIEPCRKHILDFLRERFLTLGRDHLPSTSKQPDNSTSGKPTVGPDGVANGR